MLTTNRARLRKRRGIALILILGMLGLLAFIGVTFATISGQARVGARNYAQSVMRPQPAELMEFALSQLVGDTDDVRSAIRGHSLARDAYGNDAQNNGYLAQVASFSAATLITSGVRSGTIQCITNIPAATDIYQPYYGYDFTRWVVQFNHQYGSVNAANQETRLMGQTFEIVQDDTTGLLEGGAGKFRTFFLAPPPSAQIGRRGQPGTDYIYRSPDFTKRPSNQAVEVIRSVLIGENAATPYVPIGYTFTLDGRFLRAFNGPGMGPLAQYANMRYNRGLLNGDTSIASIAPGRPNVVGMDEDYDACDLENWFLAIQSADGKAIVPSFHRPGMLQAADWTGLSAASRSRILRPRTIDGHDSVSFRNLTPDPTTGRIEYDVDNDADGITDSVWVDLGYPPVRDSRGLWYKPLFSFMVIGLNGRIPLNTAGNLQMRDANGVPLHMHTSHLGNSPSEVDPSFGLQNAGGNQLDNATSYDTDGVTVKPTPISVNVTQLRNILAGTRPYAGDNYADQNMVGGYFLPNNVADLSDTLSMGIGALPPRTVAGRWGEESYIPSLFNTGGVTPLMAFPNLVRAGLSLTGTGSPAVLGGDGRDDNYTALDFWPQGAAGESMGPSNLAPSSGLTSYGLWSTNWPADYYDAAGDTAVFSERARRFVTPIDLAGDGRVGIYTAPGSVGNDNRGRVAYNKYFRPPGIPVATVTIPSPMPQYPATTAGKPAPYDVTNNLLHGYESQRNPSLAVVSAATHPAETALLYAATPTHLDASGNPSTVLDPYNNQPVPTSGGSALPTYDVNINSQQHSAGLNEANETALYYPGASDAIFGVEDLEWLYRAHDQDGSSLYSRLSELAPLSFRDASDALRRRRLYSIDVWETNAFTWTNDNPGNNFSDNSRFKWPFQQPGASPSAADPYQVVTTSGATANASLYAVNQTGVAFVNPPSASAIQSSAPSLVHRDRKINLNFPLPVSNESTEPTRVKWITESYQFLKTILPPMSINQPEELALLSQYLINIIDFRDPDATMTQFVNPDVCVRPGTATAAPSLILRSDPLFSATTDLALTQYGMEYNPVAINEVLAYSFLTKVTGSQVAVGRFFIELVNTLTDAQTGYPPLAPPNASYLNLGGFTFTASNPYSGGCWDLIFTDDFPNTRPDPYTGQLLPLPTGATGYYSPTPLNRESFAGGQDVVLTPLAQTDGAFPTGWLYTLGNSLPVASSESAPLTTLSQTFGTSFDPLTQATAAPNPTFTIPPGALYQEVVAGSGTPSWRTTYPPTPRLPIQSSPLANKYKWVCLRRPANPFKAVSATNPMVVVDSMRFPLIEGTGPLDGTKTDETGNVIPNTTAANQIYSVQRFQPYRGGHLVPQVPNIINTKNLDVTRYGFTEQVTAAISGAPTNYGIYTKTAQTNPATEPNIFHSLGIDVGAGQKDTRWNRFVFNDRDFTSPAELMLVPGCPPGLFTKLFVEAEPTASNTGVYFNRAASPGDPPPSTTSPVTLGLALPAEPQTYPYLVDQLFYSSASLAKNGNPTTWDPVAGPSSGGWYKMFEAFEVPSPVIGAIGTAAQGVNFDWLRQDVRPGQINLNLIMDEEVFLGLVGNAGDRTDNPGGSQQVVTVPSKLNGAVTSTTPPQIVTQVSATGAPTASYSISNTGFNLGVPVSPLKAAFTDFLKVRHGSSGYMYFGSQHATSNPQYDNLPPAQQVPLSAETPFRSLTYPDINFTIMRPAFATVNQKQIDHGITAQDSGVKNQNILNRTAPPSVTNQYYPPAIPPRRFFSLPDTKNTSNAYVVPTDTQELGYTPPAVLALDDQTVNLTQNPSAFLADSAQHPYYRSEWMQKMMNLSTVRTHQYAVWVTVGFFEVTTLGDPAMAAISPNMAYDVLGREVGMLNGKNVRHRAFFIVDRLKLSGFDPRSPGQYREAVLYRKIIQ
ncbi:hypothetical protein [Paludisphaera borealis]|uniref:Verru_Chthon cassette protein A n=1 Tax=Paludisphaera borealis TaxID=1387353 RepID=A0A1U7CUI0_9BACT|nr:hypothetical protein [Paludisphaera borealis]APW62604.1 hypothetical protein BSF38_04153 [Paludisphaera borealis]